MNTRAKILDANAARAALARQTHRPALAIGVFDPLLGAHAEMLAPLHRPLWVAVADARDPLYPTQARLELVAALRVVDRVVEHVPGIEDWGFAEVHNLVAADLALRESFLRHVRERHR